MSISKYPSTVNLPQENQGWSTVLDFLCSKFSAIDKAAWLNRMQEGKVHWRSGELIDRETLYIPQKAVCYYREVPEEIIIPFEETILYQDEHILIADKPHFLPVTPSGQQVNECLQNRLRNRTGIDELQALHRLDKDTAGLVMFSVNPNTRANYHELFSEKTIEKTYHAVAKIKSSPLSIGQDWTIENKLVKSTPSFLMEIDYEAKEANAHSLIKCLDIKDDLALFELKPITGKTHQLRVHMQSIGFPILNDRFYPELLKQAQQDYANPLQLLAMSLSFIDPLSKNPHAFESKRTLLI